ncbi:TetR/AcrR family transcriptional regulator [Roseospira visakhapatnamensis]|uniref:AcrR family transcriptional regulator n=1 Tax=Roseospira visakhapatnamensis TaxID=390880 RepID=A0A7W6RE63_9PROT|nr:TetR/AcrR family transcriptional regulator [Roseospira visakhapatnamensis]MBB4266782.1 AcrR family transcriptional regulator [Roseospira visakhapatnamensis]
MDNHDIPGSETPMAGVSDRLIDAALALAGESGWRRLTMAAIAERAGVPLNEALRVHGSRNDVLRAMGHRVDAAMLDEALGFTESDSPRDRLFDMLMRRYDALTPLRPGLAAIMRELPTDPFTFVVSMQGVYHSMGLALEAAGLPADGFRGLAARKGLAAVYLTTMRTWVKDDSADMSVTMSDLDKALDRAESVVNTLCRVTPGRGGACCGSRGRRDEDTASAPAAGDDPSPA